MDSIKLPSEEELKETFEKQQELLSWAQSLSEEQINFLCDGGWYNNAIKGYIIAAAQNGGMKRDKIEILLQGLRFAMSEKNKKDAEAVYEKF